MNKSERKRMESLYIERFIDKLPHGSGIDCDWEYTNHKNGKITFKNSFHAMDEDGYYVGYMPFKFTLEYSTQDGFTFTRVICNESKRVSFYGLKEYLEEEIDLALERVNK